MTTLPPWSSPPFALSLQLTRRISWVLVFSMWFLDSLQECSLALFDRQHEVVTRLLSVSVLLVLILPQCGALGAVWHGSSCCVCACAFFSFWRRVGCRVTALPGILLHARCFPPFWTSCVDPTDQNLVALAWQNHLQCFPFHSFPLQAAFLPPVPRFPVTIKSRQTPR